MLNDGTAWPDRDGQIGTIREMAFHNYRCYKHLVQFAKFSKGSNLAVFDDSEIRLVNSQMDFAFTE